MFGRADSCPLTGRMIVVALFRPNYGVPGAASSVAALAHRVLALQVNRGLQLQSFMDNATATVG